MAMSSLTTTFSITKNMFVFTARDRVTEKATDEDSSENEMKKYFPYSCGIALTAD